MRGHRRVRDHTCLLCSRFFVLIIDVVDFIHQTVSTQCFVIDSWMARYSVTPRDAMHSDMTPCDVRHCSPHPTPPRLSRSLLKSGKAMPGKASSYFYISRFCTLLRFLSKLISVLLYSSYSKSSSKSWLKVVSSNSSSFSSTVWSYSYLYFSLSNRLETNFPPSFT